MVSVARHRQRPFAVILSSNPRVVIWIMPFACDGNPVSNLEHGRTAECLLYPRLGGIEYQSRLLGPRRGWPSLNEEPSRSEALGKFGRHATNLAVWICCKISARSRKRGKAKGADMDKLKWAVAICAVLAILGLAVVPLTDQEGPNRVVALFGSLTIVLGLWLLARTLLRKRNRST